MIICKNWGIYMNEIINDIKKYLDIDIKNIKKYKDGTTDSIVFSINNKYLIKTMSKEEIEIQKIFFNLYKNNLYFQKIIYINNNLNYICFEFIKGEKFKDLIIDSNLIIEEIYNITKSYKKVDCDFYGYLDYSVKTPYDFLLSEINYAKEKILDINTDKVYEALNYFKDKNISKYLLHGDFGVHNFLIDNNTLRVIDPMPLVFDPLYDFYFACLSNSFLLIELDYIFKFYNRDIDYKRNLLIIVFYIRMSRSYMYDKEHFNNYLNIYNNLEDYVWK